MAKGKNGFQGWFLYPHGIYGRESPQAGEQRAVERRAKQHAIFERFRQSCERGRRFLSMKGILEYWLTQVEKAMSGPKKYWGDTKKFSCPKDKAIVYAVMMICIENTGSAIRVVPDSLQKTENYKINEYVFTWIEEFDLAVEFMDYIEADLKEKNLLPSDETSAKQRNQHPELSRPLSLKKWANIFDVSVNKIREWKNDPKSKYHFDRKSDRKWSLPLNELPAEYLEKYRETAF